MTAVRSARARQSGSTAPPRARSRTSARPLPQESVGPRLRVLSGRRSGRRDIGWRAIVVICIVGTFAALVGSVAIQSQRIALQEEADKIAAATARAHDRNRDLRIEVIQAESPQNVLDGASTAGLVEPGPVAVVPSVTPAAASGAPASRSASNQASASNQGSARPVGSSASGGSEVAAG